MPLPVAPSLIKDLIPRPGGNFCEKFLKSLNLPSVMYDIVSYLFNEDGSFTEDFQADLCNLSCKCGEGGVVIPGGLQAPTVSASDGQFSDRVLINWNAPAGAINYELYRGTTDQSGSATLLAGQLSGTTYEDLTVTPQTYYYYWVKAKNAFGTSAFSNSDRGHAGSISTTLPMISDLVASQGIRAGEPLPISLIFSKAVGAESYDFYRNTTDDFATATLIDSNRVPFDNANTTGLGASPTFLDNANNELVYLHNPGYPNANYFQSYYFWVIAKRSGPPAQSPPSNNSSGARGWAVGRGDGTTPLLTGITLQDGGSGGAGSAVPYTVNASTTKAWVVLQGAGAGGAGGGAVHGGGAAGASAVLTGIMDVVPGAKFRVVSTPTGNGTTQAASETNGQNGSQAKLQYSANGTWSDVIDILIADAPSGGVYNAGGAGAGGAGASGSKHASVTQGGIFDGKAGLAAGTPRGGRSGYRFSEYRKPAGSNGSLGSPAGSGGSAHATSPLARVAGKGVNGMAAIVPYAS